MCIEDAYIRLQLQQRRDDILRLKHLWLTPLVSSVPYTSHVNAANALANGDTSQQLTWLPLIVTLPSEDFARFLISMVTKAMKAMIATQRNWMRWMVRTIWGKYFSWRHWKQWEKTTEKRMMEVLSSQH